MRTVYTTGGAYEMVQHGEQVDHEYELVEVSSETNPSSTTGGTKETPCLALTPKPRPVKLLTAAPPSSKNVCAAKEEEKESAH